MTTVDQKQQDAEMKAQGNTHRVTFTVTYSDGQTKTVVKYCSGNPVSFAALESGFVCCNASATVDFAIKSLYSVSN